MDVDRAVKAFLRLRDERTKLKREFDEKDTELKSKQNRIEVALLEFLNKSGLDNAKTPHGTFYRQEEITPSASDWDAVYAWMVANDAFEIMERRLKKTFISDYMERHEGTPPPGVSVYRSYAVRVRRG